MSWLQAFIEVTPEHADSLGDALMEVGALSTSVEQDLERCGEEEALFEEPGTPNQGLWSHCILQALFSPDAELDALIASASRQVGLDGKIQYRIRRLDEQDWVTLTQAQFEPILISPGLWIVPSWHEVPNPNDVNIRLDPGQAFGTGSHPTTRLCLQWLKLAQQERWLETAEVLDYGCGSGILAIAAGLLGAGSVTGVDIDPVAVTVARDNALRNQVDGIFSIPDRLAQQRQFDIVIANILAIPLMVLAPLLLAHLKPGGRLVLSGILSRQADSVREAYAPECPLESSTPFDDWVCLTGIRRTVVHPL